MTTGDKYYGGYFWVAMVSFIVPIFVENYRRYIADQPLKYVVDFAAGY